MALGYHLRRILRAVHLHFEILLRRSMFNGRKAGCCFVLMSRHEAVQSSSGLVIAGGFSNFAWL